MSGSVSDKFISINDYLKMSMIPLPCQESQLNNKHDTSSECIEWLLDLKDKTPIWSRLNEINTSGFKRKLPMSMTKSYNIEINGRLWSLWAHKRKHRNPHNFSKSYMAKTIMALCAARVMRLNIWNTNLMDCIRDNGRKFYKQSLQKLGGYHKDFRLGNLDSKCSLEGIRFKISLKNVQQGELYSLNLENKPNLALALKRFLNSYQFGVLECCERILGFGFIDGARSGYFMYDAQTSNYPLFPNNVSAPYLLRTNHLQVLLYCLIVTLNVPRQAEFYLWNVHIKLIQPSQTKFKLKSLDSCISKCEQTIPSRISQTTSILIAKRPLTEGISNIKLFKAKHLVCTKPIESKNNTKKYRRKLHNITKEQVEKSPIKPLVDPDHKSDEDIQLKRDFLRKICSATEVPVMQEDLPQSSGKEFYCDFFDMLLMRPSTRLLSEFLEK